MRKVSAALAVMGALFAVPAAAEVRVEGRGGIMWVADQTDAVIGVAAGYDADLGSAFVGGELSADKALVRGASVYMGLSGRGGARLGPDAKIFAAGGYTFGEGEDVWHLGGGYEHMIGRNLYLKGEYRHFFGDFVDGDQLLGGIGFRF